jgi:AcrR family transcriptional regulator
MSPRLRRVEQTERNRSLVLSAARRVFMARGYHGATLEQIAEAAGFSKGVVYSQFDSKADLFLALLERRIEERASENAKLIEGLAGEEGVAAVLQHVAKLARAEPKWGQLVIEFRVHAARDPQLGRRYASAHARTVAGVAGIFETLYERAGEEPPFLPRQMAEVVLAIGAGAELEQAANPDALDGPLVAELLTRLLIQPARSVA